MNLSVKQKQTHRLVGGGEGLGVGDLQMQTIIYRMDKQQGPTV